MPVDTERQAAGEQVPKKQVEDVSWQIAEWLRTAFAQFLSSESRNLMGIEDPGEFQSPCNWRVPRYFARGHKNLTQN